MAKVLNVILVLLGLTAAVSACAQPEHARYAEGTHYEVMDTPVSVADPDKIEVREFFFYGCPHCYDAEPIIADWLSSRPEDVNFVRTPVTFIRGSEPPARAFYIAETKGMLEKIHRPLFDAIHKHREPLFTATALSKFFEKYGLSQEEFNELYGSFGVTTKVRKADTLTRESKIMGVPAFTVAGKYRILRKNLKSDIETFKVIDYLVEKERKASNSSDKKADK